jgi:hypothetical protein
VIGVRLDRKKKTHRNHTGYTEGYHVSYRVYDEDLNGKRVVEYVSCKEFGKARAFKIACAIRKKADDNKKKRFQPDCPKAVCGIRIKPLSETGIVGVSIIKQRTKNGKPCNPPFLSYRASWDVDDIKHTRSFAVTKYGKEEALRLAKVARLEGITPRIIEAEEEALRKHKEILKEHFKR